MKRALGFAVAAAALVALVLPGCGDGDGGNLVVYSGRSENLIGPLLADFEQQTGIEVDVKYDDSANLALLIDQEGGGSPADVFISQSPGAVGFLDQKGRLAPLDDDVLALVDPDNRADDGTWVGLSGRIRTLVYNTDLVDPASLPDSVLDLVEPAFKGRVALAPSNGSFQDFVTGMRLDIGDDAAAAWLSAMADNDAEVYANNTAIVEAVGRGEVEMGLVNHYYNAQALAEDPSTPSANHFFGEGDIGALLIVTAASVIETSDKSDDAGRLVEFLLSGEAQRFFADDEFEYPLAAGVEPSGGLPALDSLALHRVDFDELGGGLERTADLIADSGLDRN